MGRIGDSPLTRLSISDNVSRMTRQDAYLSVSQVAAVLNVHPATVRRWIAAGALTATRLPGGTYRVAATDLEQIVGAA